ASANKMAFVGRFEVVSPQSLFNRGWRQLMRFSSLYTGILHNGFLRSYLVRIIIFAELLLSFELFKAGPLSVDIYSLAPCTIYEAMNVLLLVVSLYLVVKASSRHSAVVGLSVAGFAICLTFVLSSAPGLVMTQFTIDTLPVVLFAF